MIKGKHVYFRAIEKDDLPLLAEMLNDPEISSLVGGFSFPVSMAEQENWFRSNLGGSANTQRWIVSTNAGEAIGLTGLWEIDWVNRHALTALKLANRDIRGKGYGKDAILTLMSYAFYKVGLNRLWGEILPFNIASYKAYVEKCAWKVEGVHRQHIFRDGKYYDQLRVGVLKSDAEKLDDFASYMPKKREQFVKVLPDHLGGNSYE